MRYIIRAKMPFHVVDPHNGNMAYIRHGFCGGNAHQQRTDKPRTARNRNEIQFFGQHMRFGKDGLQQRIDRFQVFARGNLRHNPSKKSMVLNLGRNNLA